MAETLVERVAEILHRYSMLTPGGRAGVAVSGGADSVALLWLLNALAERFQTQLLVLHLNHQLRGQESDEDEAFVRCVAAMTGLPVIVERSSIKGGNIEAEARRVRREFFERSRISHGLTTVALGHTRSDQAETVLHHILRGSGLAGLAAMRFVSRDGFIRPLLGSSREEVRAWAHDADLRWREDSSNSDLKFTRNRIRLQTLPYLKAAFNVNLEGVLASTASLAQAEEDYWQASIGGLFEQLARRNRLGLIFQTGDLEKLDLAVRRRLIRRALQEVRVGTLAGIDFAHVEAVLDVCQNTQGHDRVVVPGAEAIKSFDSLLLTSAGRLGNEPRGYSIELGWESYQDLPHGAGRICIRRVNPAVPICDKFKEDQEFIYQQIVLDDRLLAGHKLLVRNWRPGDELHRSGHQSSEKIKRLFQENRVLLWERRHWPTVECEGEIVWVRDFGAAKKFEVRENAARRIELLYGSKE